MAMQFYDILEQTKYQIRISKPKNIEDLSDLFVSREELDELIGPHRYINSDGEHISTMRAVVNQEIMKWGDKLIASGKKTLPIDDQDLLDVLKSGYVTDYTHPDTRFGRHGDRICYARRYTRKKTKVTRGDVNDLWSFLFQGWYTKFKCWPAHVPRYDRSISMFKAFKKIVGWRLVRGHMNKEYVQFYRQIWDNPEEHI
jgi:hypothetical protein